MSQLTAESQKLEASPPIELFTLDASTIGGGVYRFCGSKEPDGGPVRFSEEEYPFVPLETEGFAWDTGAAMPRPQITISALNQTFYSLVVSTRGLQGAFLRRDRTLARFLDGHEDGGRNLKFPSDLYRVDRIISMDKNVISFELCGILDLPRCKLPARRALRNLCCWRYRRWNKEKKAWAYEGDTTLCPYAGDEMFTERGEETFDKTEDCCGRKLSDCVMRFGSSSNLPFGAFPGIARVRAAR